MKNTDLFGKIRKMSYSDLLYYSSLYKMLVCCWN